MRVVDCGVNQIMNKEIQTEAYIVEEENRQKNWNMQYAGILKQAISMMNQSLRTRKSTHIQELQDFFGNTEIVRALSEVNEFAFMLVAMEIYELEKAANICNHIFYWADSLESLIDVIRKVKFLLWEIEFLGSEESGKKLLAYLEDINISMPAFEYMMHISCYDKKSMVAFINKLLA